MSVSATPRAAGNVAGQYKATRLFVAGALALTMAGINAALRANTASDLTPDLLEITVHLSPDPVQWHPTAAHGFG